MHKPVTLGVIVGNRGFFPAHLCEEGRTRVLAALAQEGHRGHRARAAGDDLRRGREPRGRAQKCADLFRAHRDEIDGVLVTLPNFGDERAIANTLRWAELDVPVLVHAFADDGAQDDASRTGATASAARCRPATTCASTASRTR